MRRQLGLALGLAAMTACIHSGPAPLEPAGAFSFETVVEGQAVGGRIVITEAEGRYGGVIEPNWGPPPATILDVTVADPEITIVATWGAEDVVLYMTFTGDTFTGEWVMGFDGGDLTGARLPAER